ncbi:cell division protein FtsQ/DivIB [Altibacter sp. HG106]|uniref:cell division protein FtsQ/DivIB n=1 Tax=Altibacter sp. HG106 TaxID=3023937 RepID=UPI002350B252|nr:cell division protein FtsQ/DivIB [Altibacter sp. HG106]MDC7994429.1 cell division protein FtsQ/DivIB [Altibacter sp. HG106]
MKRYQHVILVVTAILLIGGLFGFTQKRNSARYLTGPTIEFMDENEPFITRSAVNKLLIQNYDSLTGITKEKVVLKEMESRLSEHPMIRGAQVFMDVEGGVGVQITQRNPIGRIAGSPQVYLDADGAIMPLSPVYAARVPLITGPAKEHLEQLTAVLLDIENDPFLKSSVVGVEVAKKGHIKLRLREYDGIVYFGKASERAQKFQNLKAFYKKAKEKKVLHGYRDIHLEFGNQVVATKKE